MQPLQHYDRPIAATLLAFAAVHALTAVWAVVAPGSFIGALVPFGPASGHLVDDYAAASAAFAVAFVLATRVQWRLPLLLVGTTWTGLHALSHLAAMGDATDSAVAWVEAVLLVASTCLLVGLALAARRAHVR